MSRRSVGGRVVEESLRMVSLDELPATTSLVETTLQRRLDVVLVQNAWNVVALRQFVRLWKPYPLRWRTRALLRRLVTQANLRRAKRVVCLTEAVAEMCRPVAGDKVVTTPVAFPLHLTFPEHVPPPVPATAVVVGALTWYKRPALALEVLARHAPHVKRVTFLGSAADMRVWDEIEKRASSLGVAVEQVAVPHAAMASRYSSAEVTVLPSALESLGFGVVEALTYGHRVLASDIPAHRDAAAVLGGRQPEWFDAHSRLVPTPKQFGERVGREDVVVQWRTLWEALCTP